MHIFIKKTAVPSLILIAIALALFLGCEKEGSSEFSSQVEYYKYNQLKNIYENEILPLNTDFTAETKLLEQSIKAFQQEATLANLVAVQEKWKAVQMVWKQLELYDLGNVANSFLAFEINRWPTDMSRIDANIAGTETLNEAFISSIGSSSKGISGIEYLIFDADQDAKILNTFTNEEKAARRMSYLLALSENLATKSIALKVLWESNKTRFIRALDNGIDGSQNQVINAMVSLTEEIIISKLGNALGDSNGGSIEPKRLEAHKSEFSKEIIQQHLTALKKCYKGDFAQTPFRVGFDDFLTLIGSEKLSNKIKDQFKICQTKMDAVSGSLEEGIVNDSKPVLELKNSFRDLLVLIKVDKANVLGSTITFNDNDGD